LKAGRREKVRVHFLGLIAATISSVDMKMVFYYDKNLVPQCLISKNMVGDFLDKKNSQKDYRLLVFTDLDGTLLDHESYSFEPALPALAVLKDNNIPLIVCTSKTRAEIELIRVQLNNLHPFISENGGAIFIPRNYFLQMPHATREDADYSIIELGTPYSRLREVFNRIQSAFPGKLRGFGDSMPGEVAELCGLPLADAKLAMKRDYDEPFVVEGEMPFDVLQEMASHSQLQVTRGGRFYHLMGNNDKGKAVHLLRDMYQNQSGHPTTVALGDSLNDLPMLEVVDYPILLKKHDGSYDPSVTLDNLILSRSSGPSGWSETLLELLPALGVLC
jgi:mannosyl-3-phosphoglycerate phosphatase